MLLCRDRSGGPWQGGGARVWAEGEPCLIPAIIYEAPPMPQCEGSNEVQEQAGVHIL